MLRLKYASRVFCDLVKELWDKMSNGCGTSEPGSEGHALLWISCDIEGTLCKVSACRPEMPPSVLLKSYFGLGSNHVDVNSGLLDKGSGTAE